MISYFLHSIMPWRNWHVPLYLIKRLGIVGAICFLSFLIYALWPTERGSIIAYKYNNVARTGERIIALPGESIRISPATGSIYIKIKDKAYRLHENYLPDDTRTYTSEPKFTSGWYTLADDEYLVISDRRVSQLNDYWDNFVREENFIRRDQIIKKASVGRRMNFGYEPIDPKKEFSIVVNPKNLLWHTIANRPLIRINGAKPVVSGDYIFVPTIDHHLMGVDKKNGHVLWEQTFSKTIKTITTDPDKLLLFVSLGEIYPTTGDTGEVLIAIDQKSGKEIWKANYTEIRIPEDPQELSVLLTINDGMLTGLDKQTGMVRWHSSSIDYYETSAGAYGGAVLIQNDTNNLSLIEPNTGTTFWTTTNMFPKGFNVIGEYKNIILVYDDTSIHAIDKQTGKEQWLIPAGHISDSNQKIELIDDSLITLDPQGRTRGLGASDIPSAYERRVLMTKRSIISGAIVWQRLLPNAGLHASIVADTDKQLLVRTGDGGNSYEDWGIVERFYSIDKNSGHIIFDRPLPTYARLFTIGNIILIAQDDLLCIDAATGNIHWEMKNYASANDKDHRDIDAVVDERNKLLFIRNHDVIERISLIEGKKTWSQKVKAGYGDFYLGGDSLFLRISDTRTLYGIHPDTGIIKLKISDVYTRDTYWRPYQNSRGEVFFWRFTNLEMKNNKLSLYRFDPTTDKEQSVFSQVVLNDSDIQFINDPVSMYVFSDDSVYGLDLK